jgi:hypothetical protein
MEDIKVGNTNANDINLHQDMYAKAYDKGMSFSQYLENIDPSDPKDAKNGLDAFERQLMRFGIRTKNDPRTGMGASTGDLFFQSNIPASRILFPEFLNRVARVAVMSQDDIMSQLVATTETLQGSNLMRSIYIDDTQAQRTKSRVAEMGEFPVVKVTWSEKATALAKYGVRIEMSYEFVRRASLPVISILLQRIMLQTRLDEVGEAVNALHAGDGSGHASGGTISTSNLSTYQGGTPEGTGEMTYAGYLAWLAVFYPGKCTTIISNAADTVKYLTMPKPTVDPLFLYSFLNPGLLGGVPERAVNWPIPTNITPVIHANVVANTLVGIDKSAAMIAVREAGADLTETDKIINGQFNQIVMSNTVGFQMLFASARKEIITVHDQAQA